MATQKELFVNDLLDLAQALNTFMLENTPDIVQQWQSLGYASAGSDPIVDGDLTAYNGLTAAQLNSFIGAIGLFDDYFNNVSVPAADRVAIFTNLKFVEHV